MSEHSVPPAQPPADVPAAAWPTPPLPPRSTPPTELVEELRRAGCVFAEEEAQVICATTGDPGERRAMARRRAAGEPLEHVVGWAEFGGLRVGVAPGVFVPRRRTEFLAELAVGLLPRGEGARVLDLCCGTGAIGAVLAARGRRVEVHACDLDPAAVACARRNLAPAAGQVHEGDLFAALPPALRGRFDVVAANVPYVPAREIPLLPAEAREHEAALALDGGTDGLAVLRRVAADAPGWLAPGGSVLSETTEEQVPAALAALRAAGLTARTEEDDDRGAVVVIGTRPCGAP
jgi:release factor glutamine methyltransferase